MNKKIIRQSDKVAMRGFFCAGYKIEQICRMFSLTEQEVSEICNNARRKGADGTYEVFYAEQITIGYKKDDWTVISEPFCVHTTNKGRKKIKKIRMRCKCGYEKVMNFKEINENTSKSCLSCSMKKRYLQHKDEFGRSQKKESQSINEESSERPFISDNPAETNADLQMGQREEN